jgi:DNA segregation ATPase FtsK/SpoIIIE, S-DNA-T family
VGQARLFAVTKRATTSARGVRPRGKRAAAGGRTFDLEAVGLLLLAAGVALAGLLTPLVRSGDLGVATRALLAGPVGVGAWVLPPPFIVLGTLFLFRRYPRAWPRVLLGYALAATGAWGFVMLAAPDLAGTWGAALLRVLSGSAGALAGVLAGVPAFLLLTVGIDLIAGLRPTRIVRGLIRATARLTRLVWALLLAWRTRARRRAAFAADVAHVRRALVELDRDLSALERLYATSGEITRWRRSVKETLQALRRPRPEVLDDARADVAAWGAAVRDFARDRAAELAARFRDEGARPEPIDGGEPGVPRPRSEAFESWWRAAKGLLDDPVAGTTASARALDRVRSALALDLTALADRHRRLTRERDLAERALERMAPRELVKASAAHAERMTGYRSIEAAAQGVAEGARALDGWRDHVDATLRAVADHPDAEEVADYDRTLAEALRERGRDAFADLDRWGDALEAVVLRAREDELLRARRAAAPTDGAPPAPGGVHDGTLEEALLDEQHFHLNEHAAWVVPGVAGPDGGATPPSGAAPRLPGAPGSPTGRADRPPWDTATESRPLFPAPAADEVVGGIPIQLPAADLLDPPEPSREDPGLLSREVRERVAKIDATLNNFKLEGRVVSSVRGPSVTRFEVEPAPGEKISRFANLSDDLALAMAVGSVRIEAPIPGKSVIGLEVPNAQRELIRFREAVESLSFKRTKARLPLIVGRSIDGEMIVGDLARMPHLLIAGSTGSGKSVAVNTLIGSLLYRFLPTELRFLMIDPKMVELTPFDGIPHLIRPVVTNPSDAAGVLLGAVQHMERRYKMMSKIGAKNLDQYNAKAKNLDLPELPFIVIVIDELADLMITSPKEVESAIMRLAQMARATGMHLILATQRPSVDILTSLIKVNVPARMAFAVSSGYDSRTVLDTMGAERLIGLGDMLFYQPGLVKPVRLQGPYVSEAEIGGVAGFLRRQFFEDDFVEAYAADFEPVSSDDSDATGFVDWNDDKLRQAAELVINEGQASVSRLQRRLQVGHARAGKLMDSLEALGVVGPHTGSKPREVLIAFEELPNVFGR